jgi:hypothetical protein
MAHTISKATVKDFAAWKAEWDKHAEERRQVGQRHYHVYQVEGDPNQMFLLLEWESMEKVREFVASGKLAEVMEKSGVTEVEVWLVDEVEKGAA